MKGSHCRIKPLKSFTILLMWIHSSAYCIEMYKPGVCGQAVGNESVPSWDWPPAVPLRRQGPPCWRGQDQAEAVQEPGQGWRSSHPPPRLEPAAPSLVPDTAEPGHRSEECRASGPELVTRPACPPQRSTHCYLRNTRAIVGFIIIKMLYIILKCHK